MNNIAWLKDLKKGDEGLVGKKAALLGEIFSIAPIPNGFVILPSAFTSFISLKSWEINIVLNNNSLNKVEKSERIRALIRSITLPKSIKNEISDAYTQLCENLFLKNAPHSLKPVIPVMVRTSLMMSSFISSSTLWASGIDIVLKSIESCWINLFDEQAVEYIKSNKVDIEKIKLVELIQAEIYTHKSGFIYTLNQETGEENQLSINTCWGLTDYFYLDEKQPTHYLITKSLEIIERDHRRQDYAYTISRKTGEQVKKVIPEEERAIKVIDDEEALSLARLALRIEEHLGELLKLEFAILKDKSYIIQVEIIPKIEIKEEKIVDANGQEKPENSKKPSFIEDNAIEILYEPSEFHEEEEEQNHVEHDFETELGELFSKYRERYPELAKTLNQIETEILKTYKIKK